ncbi:MAG: glycosyltransferase family 4 protein [Roseiarcus sp.]|jgi:glycosyltransferase involved in cell wall biosynthesis
MAGPYPPAAVVRDLAHPARRSGDWEVRPGELRELLRSGALLRHFLRHSSARLLVGNLDADVSWRAALATRLLTAGPASIEDRSGRALRVDSRALVRLGLADLRDLLGGPRTLREAHREIAALERRVAEGRAVARWDRASGVLALSADPSGGAVAGGAIAHLVGVIGELSRRFPVTLVAPEPILLLDPAVRQCIVPAERSGGEVERRRLRQNASLIAAAEAAARPGCLVYQRHGVFGWAGAALAWRRGLPLVLEYNGPEVWIARHWACPLRHPALAERIERIGLAAADCVTVVSEPLRARLLAQGVADRRILVNPNGVDLARFAPALDGGAVRARFGLGGRIVIGFIGTFGPWHGVEILVEAFARVLARRPHLQASVRLLLIGDGDRLPAARSLLTRAGRLGEATLTGIVAQREGPAHLAACDILALPTLANPDGSPFFGSPTKLFEYMAMGRAIVASRLGQAAEMLEDGESALLVPPGDADGLARALARLIDDSALRGRLGAAARARAEARHGWGAHVTRLLESLAAM